MEGSGNMEGNMSEIGGKEFVDQIEGSLSDEEGDELKKVVFLECGEIFSQSGYKFIVHAFVAQKPTQTDG